MHPLFEALLAVKQLHPKMENKIQFPKQTPQVIALHHK